MTIIGSKWRKWNFHVHTKGTNKNDLFSSSSMDDFFHIFFKKAFENQISAIAITDYFSIHKYLEALEYRRVVEDKAALMGNKFFNDDERKFIKDICIFTNVELSMLPSTDRGRVPTIH